jgi:acyl carrier protein
VNVDAADTGGAFDDGAATRQVDGEEVLLAVRRVLSEYLTVDLEDIRPEMRLFELPDVDSMKLMVAGLRFEHEFGVTFEMDNATATRTVAEVADLATRALRGSL